MEKLLFPVDSWQYEPLLTCAEQFALEQLMLYISQITLDTGVSVSGNCGKGDNIPESRSIWLPNNELAGEAFVLL